MALPSSARAPGGGPSELEALRAAVAAYFPVYETKITAQSVVFTVDAAPATLEGRFDRLRSELWTRKYVPVLRFAGGEYTLEVLARPPISKSRIWVNLLLLAATVGTTTLAGALIWLAYVGQSALGPIAFYWGAVYFSLPLLAILGVHELAHYALARRHRIEASLPYFMPIPPPFLFGTLGAFISTRQPFTDRKALFDVGVAGPLAGFAVAIPVTIAGMYLSVHGPATPLAACGPSFLGTSYSGLLIGSSAIWYALSLLFPVGLVSLSPLALAGWVGILVTAINLLPAGSLDGGHVWRALLGDRAKYVSIAAVVGLFGLGLLTGYLGWLILGLLVFVLGLRHPPPLNDISKIGLGRALVGVAVAGVLVGGFVLVPVAAPSGAVGLALEKVSPGTAGPALAANLSFTVSNPDPEPFAFVFSGAVVNVSVVGPDHRTVYLGGAQFAAYAANSSWSFRLPNGRLTNLTGGAVSVAPGNFTQLNASSTGSLTVGYANAGTDSAGQVVEAVGVTITASELCPPSTGGSASQTIAFGPAA